ncbi:MAG: tetratricopeptide repeat protein [Candidatus Competibacteraceae bacterium]
MEPGYSAAHANLGRLRFGQGRYQQAADHYTAAVQALPHSADALVGLGCALEELQCHAEAEQTYRRALTIDPDFPGWPDRTWERLLITFGQVDLDQQRYPQAIERYNEALRMLPGSANAWVGLGCAFASLNVTPKQNRLFNSLDH